MSVNAVKDLSEIYACRHFEQNQVKMKFISGVNWNNLPKRTFQKTSLQLVNTYELPLAHGDDVLQIFQSMLHKPVSKLLF